MNALAPEGTVLEQGLPATAPRPDSAIAKMLLIDVGAGTFHDRRIADLSVLLGPGHLLVVNDAATLPSSLRGVGPGGEPLEVRLAGQVSGPRWMAVLFGAGSWRMPTERRALQRLQPGDRMSFGSDLDGFSARVVGHSEKSPRLLEIEFDRRDEALMRAFYRWGRPVQYSYLERDLDLWDVQNGYASRPWASEQPSAGRPLRWGVLLGLLRRGVEICALTHAAGLSSAGDPQLDSALPLPERYELSEPTVAAVARARERGGRIVAVGTSVVRALEGSAAQHGGSVRAGVGETALLVGPAFRPRVVDGLLTGFHDPVGTHFALLQAFAPGALLHRAYRHASRTGYLWHELGDSMLILGGEVPRRQNFG